MNTARTVVAWHRWRTCAQLAAAALLVVAGAVVPRGGLQAQSSIVPATHSVYDWLEQQRVFGRLPTYEAEELPMTRATILGHLRTLERDTAQLSRTDRELLTEYLNEFDFARLQKNGVFTHALVEHPVDAVIDAIRERRDPFIFAGHVADSSISAALWVREDWGYGWNGGAGNHQFEYLYGKGIRAFVNSTSGLGFHFEVDMADADAPWIYRLDPRLGVSERLLQDTTTPPAAYETWISYQRPNLFVTMGKGASVIGPSITDPMWVRLGAPSLGQFRITLGPPKFHLTFIHGQLDGDTETDTSWVNGKEVVTQSPVPRWMALTRLTWNPSPRFGLTLDQMTVYSGRGIDFEYLNPLLPSLFGGLDKGSADNGFVGFDAIARPVNGTELKYSVLIDDAEGYNFKPFGHGWAKIANMAGVEQRLPFDIKFGFSYTRVDAYVYTSGVLSDAWEISNVPIGPA
ncbi:MAG TPA: hypothetical protein VMH39_03305, partial [Gemmatimonadaceae bacterium]|nr:hypothetical protein [Gemmatimonadaceae bacterium]